MLSNISWQGYWTSLAITVFLYYTFVFLFFYRKPLIQYFQRRSFTSPLYSGLAIETKEQVDSSQDEGAVITPEADAPEYVPAVHSLVDEVHAFFESLDPTFHSKETLLTDLKVIIQKHVGVKGSRYQYSLNNLILFLAEQNGGFHLSAEEVGSIWL